MKSKLPGKRAKRMSKKPISRAGDGYFARVYRDNWVGSRSFADSKYNGNAAAARAAETWVKLAEEALPKIPPRPELRKATVKRYREDKWDSPQFYYQVYLPIVDARWGDEVPTVGDSNRQPYELKKLYYKDLDEEQEQRTLAYDMAQVRNDELRVAYKQDLIAWYLERDRIMEKILDMWLEIKDIQLEES